MHHHYRQPSERYDLTPHIRRYPYVATTHRPNSNLFVYLTLAFVVAIGYGIVTVLAGPIP